MKSASFTRSFNRMLQEIEARDAEPERQHVGLINQVSNRPLELLAASRSGGCDLGQEPLPGPLRVTKLYAFARHPRHDRLSWASGTST